MTKNVPAYSVWYGNPARHKGYVTADGVLLDKHFVSKEGVEYYLRMMNWYLFEGLSKKLLAISYQVSA